ncbi:MAG: hypothetical protein J7L11_07170 [Thermoprotei archaeon]|nr:hypothetical protein [Thermoprotei archaeon]
MPNESLAEHMSLACWLVICSLSASILIPLCSNIMDVERTSCAKVLCEYVLGSIQAMMRYDASLIVILPEIPGHNYTIVLNANTVVVVVDGYSYAERVNDTLRFAGHYELAPGSSYAFHIKNNKITVIPLHE